MTKNKQRIQRMTLAAFFAGIEVLMAFTPIGYIPMAGLSITTMHLPVILAGILGGPAFGAGLGFVFGMTSLIRATMEPSVTSFVFSPFITVGGVSGNFASLLICFVPRILLGVLSGYLYRLFLRLMHKSVPAAALSAVINTVLHTAGVLGGIYIFFGPQYASALGTGMRGLVVLLLGVVSSNMVLEAILAGVVIPVLVRALAPSAVRMGLMERTA